VEKVASPPESLDDLSILKPNNSAIISPTSYNYLVGLKVDA